MDKDDDGLIPAAKLARENPVRIRNESPEYRAARTKLLAEEIELRRHIERVSAQRRALPPGGVVSRLRASRASGAFLECSAKAEKSSSIEW